MMNEQQIAGFLVKHGYAPAHDPYAGFLPRQVNSALAWRYATPPTPEELGLEIYQISESEGLRLGNWLGTPDGEILTRAVEMVVPGYLRPDIELLVEGLKWASRMQGRRDQKVVGGRGVAVLVGFAILWITTARSVRAAGK